MSTIWLGPVIYMIVYPIGTAILSWNLFKLGYKSGLEGMHGFMSTGKLDTLTDTMTVLGLTVVGALTASFVTASVPFRIVRDVYDATTGTTLENQVIFEADKMLNSIFPHLVPLLLTLGVYYLYSRKKWSPLRLMTDPYYSLRLHFYRIRDGFYA
jgi:PTS system mannose-specific IID component